MAKKSQALLDLVEAAKKANDAAGANPPLPITPKEYGFVDEDDYWKYIRRAAKKAAEELTPPQ